MHQRMKRQSLGWGLLAAGLLGLSAVGCDKEPGKVAAGTSEQHMPYHIPVPHESVAVAPISGTGDVTIIAVTQDGKRDKPSVCEIKGQNECPFEFPEVVTTIEIGKVAQKPLAEVEPSPGVAFAAGGTNPCWFVLMVGNKVYSYVDPCTP